MARTQATTKRKPRKKPVAKQDSVWFNKSVFWAMFLVAISSTITACSLITKQIKADPATEVIVSLPNETISVPEADGHIHLERNIGQALMNSHLLQHHQVGELEKVFKCSNLNGKIYTCKVIESVEVAPVKKNPKPEIKPEAAKAAPEKAVEPEFVDESVPEEVPVKKKKRWNPFK
jgi:hypothetical protein